MIKNSDQIVLDKFHLKLLILIFGRSEKNLFKLTKLLFHRLFKRLIKKKNKLKKNKKIKRVVNNRGLVWTIKMQ